MFRALAHSLSRDLYRELTFSDGVSADIGTAAATLADATSSATGHAAGGTSAVTLDLLTSASTGRFGQTGTAANTLDAAISAATGRFGQTGTGAVTLDLLTSTAVGRFGQTGTAANTLTDATSTATGRFGQTGTAANTLDALTSTGWGNHTDAALEFDFQHGVIDPRISISRAGSAWTVDSTGALVSVAANTVRIWHDPNTLARQGALIEELRTNILLNSTTLSTQSVTVVASPYTLSFYGTGTVTLSGVSSAGPLVGTGANDRVSLTFTPTAGSLTCTVSGTVKWANLELGSSATSPIITAGGTVTRNADCPQVTSLGAWFNATEGTMFVDFTPWSIGTLQTYIYFDDGTSNERMGIRSSAGTNAMLVVDGNVTQTTSTLGTVLANTAYKAAMGWKLNDMAGSQNGAAIVTDATATMPTVTAMKIGHRLVSNENTNGVIRKVKIYTTRKTNAEIVAMAT
jgi:hypothetical protein